MNVARGRTPFSPLTESDFDVLRGEYTLPPAGEPPDGQPYLAAVDEQSLEQIFRPDFTVLQVRHGGMGVVYIGVRDNDSERSRPMAYKSVAPEFCYNPVLREAFERECAVSLLAGITPGILPVREIAYIDGRPFFSMRGILPNNCGQVNLRDHLIDGPLSVDRAHVIAWCLAWTMHTIAEEVPGLVHNDLTPENVLIINDLPLVSDFGVARALVTASRQVNLIGASAYRAPEAERSDEPLTVRADIYSFGVILEEMLIGESSMDSQASLISNWQTDDPEDAIKMRLLALARCCTAANPSRRPEHFGMVLAELDGLVPASLRPTIKSAQERLNEFAAQERSLRRTARRTFSLLSLQQYDAALTLIESVGEAERSFEMWAYCGLALEGCGRFLDALESLHHAKRMVRAGQAEHWQIENYRTGIFLRLGFMRSAGRALRILLATAPDKDCALSVAEKLVWLYTRTRRLTSAKKFAEMVICERPDDALGWNNLAVIYRRLGEYEQALKALRRASELEPWASEGHKVLADFLLNAYGNVDEATVEYDKSLGCGGSDSGLLAGAICCSLLQRRRPKFKRLHSMLHDRHSIEVAMLTEELATIMAGNVPTAPLKKRLFQQWRGDPSEYVVRVPAEILNAEIKAFRTCVAVSYFESPDTPKRIRDLTWVAGSSLVRRRRLLR